MAGERVARLAVDQEAYLLDAREVGEERADDGVDGEGLDLDAGGMVIGEGAAQVDDGEQAGGRLVGSLREAAALRGGRCRRSVGAVSRIRGDCSAEGQIEQKDIVDGGAALQRMR